MRLWSFGRDDGEGSGLGSPEKENEKAMEITVQTWLTILLYKDKN